jgi:hypothetical protein
MAKDGRSLTSSTIRGPIPFPDGPGSIFEAAKDQERCGHHGEHAVPLN